MCVRIKKHVKPTSRVRAAWKAICEYNPSAKSWRPVAQGGTFPRGQWVKAEHPYYGFNCYQAKAGAETWGAPVVKVRIRGVHGYGTDQGFKVIFAREIFVPKGKR